MKFSKRLKNAFLTIFGDLKFFPVPPIIVYAPATFRVKGKQTRKIMGLVEPGDLILRKYYGYLDSWFIPGRFSHTGIYIGDGVMIHAIAEGVSNIDLIDFLRCDNCIVLRPKSGQKRAIKRCKTYLGKPYDFDFQSGNKALYCHEVAAEAYKELNIEKKVPTIWKGLIRGKPTYLADSFLINSSFEVIYEFQE